MENEIAETTDKVVEQVHAREEMGAMELTMLRQAGLITKGEDEEVTEEELALAREALRQRQLATLEDLKERVSTGLPNAAGILQGIRGHQKKMPRRQIGRAHV